MIIININVIIVYNILQESIFSPPFPFPPSTSTSARHTAPPISSSGACGTTTLHLCCAPQCPPRTSMFTRFHFYLFLYLLFCNWIYLLSCFSTVICCCCCLLFDVDFGVHSLLPFSFLFLSSESVRKRDGKKSVKTSSSMIPCLSLVKDTRSNLELKISS